MSRISHGRCGAGACSHSERERAKWAILIRHIANDGITVLYLAGPVGTDTGGAADWPVSRGRDDRGPITANQRAIQNHWAAACQGLVTVATAADNLS